MYRLTLPSTRSVVIWALSLMLFSSLACSVVLRAGHADTPVAAPTDAVEPIEIVNTDYRIRLPAADLLAVVRDLVGR